MDLEAKQLHVVEVAGNLVSAAYELASETAFIPKLTWLKPPPEMLVTGLESGKWNGIALLGSDGTMASYLDYRDRTDVIDIGICMTRERFRGQGLMSHLLSTLVQAHAGIDIDIGTLEQNLAMRRVIERLGFVPMERKQDRVTGEYSMYYRHRATQFGARIGGSYRDGHSPTRPRASSFR